MDLDLKKVLLTQIIGRFYHDIYFSSYSPLQVQNLPRQSLPDSRWVRVRNRLAGIGGNDLQLLYQERDIRSAPAAAPGKKHFYPGQEVVGEVIEIGDNVRNLGVGERVVRRNGPNCITSGAKSLCPYCATGAYNLCEQSALIPVQDIGGGWSEEMLLHEQQLFRVPASLSDEQAVMIEPTAIALHALLRHLPQPGQRVLIIGAGTIGLLTQQLLHMLVPQAEIHMMARYSFQVEQATRLGAAQIIYPQDAYAGVQRATKARLYAGPLGNQMLFGGYDVIYDTIGQRKTLHHALRWTRARGAIVLVGKNAQLVNIDLSPLWYQEIDLQGSTAHGVEYWPLGSSQRVSTFEIVAELMAQGRITPEQLITHHFALNNYKNALLTATNKNDSRAIKVIFDYSLLPATVVPNVRASAPKRSRIPAEAARTGAQKGEPAQQTAPRPQTEQEETKIPVDLSAMPGIGQTPSFNTPRTGDWANANTKRSAEGGENEDTATAMPVINGRLSGRANTAPQMASIPQSRLGEPPSITPIPQSDERAGTFDRHIAGGPDIVEREQSMETIDEDGIGAASVPALVTPLDKDTQKDETGAYNASSPQRIAENSLQETPQPEGETFSAQDEDTDSGRERGDADNDRAEAATNFSMSESMEQEQIATDRDQEPGETTSAWRQQQSHSRARKKKGR